MTVTDFQSDEAPGGEFGSMIGIGLYSIPEASRLTGVSQSRIRRWIQGDSYNYRGNERRSTALWDPLLPKVEGRNALGFLDLIEVQFINFLREKKATWSTIRRAAETAKEEYKHSHPFATRRFLIKTDGKNILGYVLAGKNRQALMDLATKEFAMKEVISPSFIKTLDFDDRQAIRWWPLGRKRKVVIDPNKSFGQPIIVDRGVPTAVLADSYNAEEDISSVASWYQVSKTAVRDAIDYEARLCA